MNIEDLIIRLCIEDLINRLRIEEDNRGSEKKRAHNPGEVKVPSLRKPTTKGKVVSWDLKGGSLRRRSSKRNALTLESKDTNLQIVDCQRGTNLRKLMWLIASPRMCLTLTSQH